jgi:archaeoflavoprotein AfpA
VIYLTEVKIKKRKVAWGITGGGDRIAELIQVMTDLKKQYEDKVEIHIYLSKAGEVMLKFYRLTDTLKQSFPQVQVEINSNAPFLASFMQSGKYEFLLIAPATSNTVAKIVNGIGDTMLTNAAIMGLKSFAQVYVMPTDYQEGVVSTILPNGKTMKLRVRKEEAEQTRKLEQMDGVHVLQNPESIREVFEKHFQLTN